MTTHGGRRIVAHACERARRAGVSPGMTLAHARALLPPGGPIIAPFRPERDAAALHALAVWSVRFTPVAMPDEPDGLLLDVAGCERLYGSARAIADRIAEELTRRGWSVRIAAAPTFACAWAVARYGGANLAVVPEGREREAMAPLPVRALRIGAGAETALLELGITTVGHLLDLPRSALPGRFGPDLLMRLDQALGLAMEVLTPVRPCEPAKAERVFDGPTTSIEGITTAARELIGSLCGELARRESGATRVDLELRRSDLGPLRLTAVLSRPSRNPRHLWALLGPQIERAHLGFGVEELSIVASGAARVRHEQEERWLAGRSSAEDAAWGELIDTITGRCGPDGVLRLEPVESHVPERAIRWRPLAEPAPRGAGRAAVVESDRPSILFGEPEEAEAIALAPDSPPSRLRWRGREHILVAGIGPERIGPEWWRGPGGARDYFKVQDEAGLWLWVYRDLSSKRWFVHGLWA